MTDATARVVDVIRAATDAAWPDPLEQPVVGLLGPTDPPQRRTVLVGSSAVTPPSVACPARVYAVRVWLLSPMVAPGAADDDVDGLLDVVLDGLDAAGIGWTEAARGVWAEQYPAYVITTEVIE